MLSFKLKRDPIFNLNSEIKIIRLSNFLRFLLSHFSFNNLCRVMDTRLIKFQTSRH